MLKLYSWNINGIRAAYKKGLLNWINEVQPDILCLQETKAHFEQLEDGLRQLPGYYTYWASAVRKGYSGVALYSKIEPSHVQIGLGIPEYDNEGRTIVAEYNDFVLVDAYFPNGGSENTRVPFKLAYCEVFLETCNHLYASGKPVIFCGDINTAHQEIDLARPAANQTSTGFLPEERAWITKVIEQGYIDIFRTLNPDKTGAYTWWAFWGNARERNVGWRLDYFFITPDLCDRVVSAEIHADVKGSDHCPVSLVLEI